MSETGAAEQAHLAVLAELGLRTAALIHELRQPLFVIQGQAQLALLRGEYEERLQIILDQTAHLDRLLEAHRGLGQPGEPTEVYDLNDPVRLAVTALEPTTEVPVALDLSEQALPVRWRRSAVRQVVSNLVRNAVDASLLGETPQVCVRTQCHGDHVRLEVLDTGPGVPNEVQGRIGHPFLTTKSPDKGTGLGLYIVKHLIAEASGEFELARAGERTVAAVVLPRVA